MHCISYFVLTKSVMAFKFVVFAAVVAVAQAGNLGLVASPSLAYSAAPVAYAGHVAQVAAPVAYAAPVAKAVIAEPSAPAHYDYGYTVSDPHTGDHKSQQESRRGDVVQGSYSLVDADGTKRTVEYSADAYNGFNAVVHKEVAAVAPVVAKVAAPVAVAAPVVTKYAAAAPVAYAAPVVSYAAPALSYGSVKYASPAALSYAAPAPVVVNQAASFAYASPAASYAAPTGLSYSVSAPVVAKYATAPAYAYAAPSYVH